MIYESILHDLKSYVNAFFDFFSYFFDIFAISLDFKSYLLYNVLVNGKEKRVMVNKELHPEIGLRIRNLREQRGLEQLEVAEKLGYKSQSTVSKWESGTNLPTGKKLVKLAKVLGVSTNEILGMSDEPYTETDLRKMAENAKTFDGKPLNENDIQAIQNIIEIYLQGRL